ncbi:hypothetical protein EMGBS15_07600 [Filimonas sp.]|nr:hypothetical protein EMGBS15_07600 [Filimonas sp.]
MVVQRIRYSLSPTMEILPSIQLQNCNPACLGGSNGSITFAATGGTSPYQYALNSGTFNTTSTFTGLSTGSYTLHAKDNAGCFKDSIILLAQPNLLGFSSIQILPVSCNGGANATVVAAGNGGSPGYQYRIDGGLYGATGSFINLTAGVHTLGIKDAKACIRDSIIVIGQPTSLYFNNVTVTNPGCIGTIGVINAQGAGGMSPYTYAIGAGAYTSIGNFSNLPAANHLLHLKDVNGCIHDTLITLINNPLISLSSLNHSSFICGGGNNGFISTFANSVNSPVFYSYNGGPSVSSGYFSNLTPGSYTVHAQDQAGCYVDSVITIQATPPIVIAGVTMDTVLCNSSSDGGILLYALGGLGPLRYAMDAGNYSVSNSFTNLAGGIYTMHVRDSLLCQKDSNVNLTAPPAIFFSSINLFHPHCSSATDGGITINALGGQAPYLYAINSSLFTTNNQFQNLFQGTYTVHIKDYNNCLHDTVITLNATNYMDFSNVVITDVSCKFGNSGSISVAATGGFSPYQFTINAVSTGTFSLFANLGAGSYTINVTDNLGCQEDTVINVNEPTFPVSAQILNVTPNLCRGDSIGTATAGGVGGTTPYFYSIDGSPFQSFPIFNGLLAGSYVIEIKDVNGCLDDTIAVVTEPDTSAQLFY